MFFLHQRKNNPRWGGSVLVLPPREEEQSALGRLRSCSTTTRGRTICVVVGPFLFFCHQRKNNPHWGCSVPCSPASRGRTIRIGVGLFLFFLHQRKNNPRWGCSVLVLLPREEEQSALGRFRTCSSATKGRAISIWAAPYLFFCHQRKNNPRWGGSVLVLLPAEEEQSALGWVRSCSSATRERTIGIGAGPFLFS